MTNLEVKEDGLIYVDGILVSDQEKARELLFLKHCIFPKEIALKQATGIYPIPDLQWEVVAKPIQVGFEKWDQIRVAILKESKPLPHGSKCIMQDESIPFVEAPQLRSAEEMTLQECKEKIAKGRNWESYRTFYLMAGFPEIIQVNDEAAELYASQFKSHSPIEQKTDYKVERQRFIDDYTNNRERENMRDSLGRIFDMWIIPLACRIKELESQSLPIEGVEREWISVKEREPEEEGPYLCFHKGKIKKLWFGIDSDWSDLHLRTYWWTFWFTSERALQKWDHLDDGDEPTHWRPLPPPPKNG